MALLPWLGWRLYVLEEGVAQGASPLSGLGNTLGFYVKLLYTVMPQLWIQAGTTDATKLVRVPAT